jgi:hypothetical protein
MTISGVPVWRAHPKMPPCTTSGNWERHLLYGFLCTHPAQCSSSFLQMGGSIWNHFFFLSRRTFFNISYGAGDEFSQFASIWKYLFSRSFLKGIFTEYRILDQQDFKDSCFLSPVTSNKKPDIICTLFPCMHWACFAGFVHNLSSAKMNYTVLS